MIINIPVRIENGAWVHIEEPALLVFGDWAIVNATKDGRPVRGSYDVVSIDEGLSACHEDLELLQACRYIKQLPPKADSDYPAITNAWDAFCQSEGLKPRRSVPVQ